MKKSGKKLFTLVIPVIMAVLGAVGGFLYYRFVGCASGTCPITSSPVLMPLYGALMGYLLSMIFSPGTGKAEDEAE